MLNSVSEPTIKLTKAPNSDTAAQEKQVGWASTGGGQASRARPPARSALATSIKPCASRLFRRADGAQRRLPARPLTAAPRKLARALR